MIPAVNRVPDGACDTHVHLFGPSDRYPLAKARIYTPGDALEPSLSRLHHRLGIARTVVVQPSVYGTDNSRMLAGLQCLGAGSRGVAVIDTGISDDELDRLHVAGVRGVRVNIATHGMNDPDTAWALIRDQARCVKRLGWHVQILTRLPVIKTLAPQLRDLGSLVIDHFGLPDMAKGIDQPGFEELCGLVSAGSVTVKVSAIERLCGPRALGLAVPFIRALVNANDGGVVWGSDWPHTGGSNRNVHLLSEIEPFQDIDDQHALDCLSLAVPQQPVLDRILAGTPARLYDFPSGSAAHDTL